MINVKKIVLLLCTVSLFTACFEDLDDNPISSTDINDFRPSYFGPEAWHNGWMSEHTHGTDVMNELHLEYQVQDFFTKNPNKDIPVEIEYVTYKKDSTSIEESQQLKFALELKNMGYKLSFDPRSSGPINAIFFDWKHGSLWGGSSNNGEDYGIGW